MTDELKEVRRLTAYTDAAREALDAALTDRDNAIRTAINDGVTMYRIAKETGLTETAIRKIRDK